ncbi:hypothetical protein CLAFUW4_00106 [Fulvia fulva]|uniref:Uncharacterized protein n=1 Tax=Passalora fulva TaxID=5499 RepID=A0A9Q8L5J8_PASFU|nr:uncharacterized protein CLAFUR5_00105 [Fulvia fulva]KAK4635978.1 hypothetical protein CLAFUR4_00106 [Fulvia fulva]KAK4638562.1 hypothetical protein CLAFUR0_00104 [Fulvia fulva]UJO11139.1 hypothetical protein CLAFUR5_00105 [Fulvia fulva]WPV09108.1 hypothetical protein CLAFUW4_00106 [Fulvia fulva]WPV25116.1 hypothetical protein CLAFUW7_00106 [Fulvia fulva]
MRLNISKIVEGGRRLGQHLKIFRRRKSLQLAKTRIPGASSQKQTQRQESQSNEELQQSIAFVTSDKSPAHPLAVEAERCEDQDIVNAAEQSKEPVILNGWSSKDLGTGPPEATMIDHGSGRRAAIVLNVDLAVAIKTSLAAHLEAKAVEDETNAEMASLGPRFFTVQQEMESLQISLADDENDKSTDRKRARLSQLTAEQDSILNRQAELRTRLQEQYEDMRNDQIPLFDILKICMSGEPDICEPETGATEEEDPVTAEVSSKASLCEPIPEQVDSSSDAVPDTVEASADPAEERTNGVDIEELLYNFHAFKEQLEEVELQFESRHEHLDVVKGQGQADTLSESDAHCIRQTQRLTRALIQAEQEFQDAKDALLAAGYQAPGSDLASGFIDDVNDGYRLSLEQDIIDHVDKGRILNWLSSLPELEGDRSEIDDALPTPEVDEWKGDEAEMCDSWSMVADGADRRRIDKWRTLATS